MNKKVGFKIDNCISRENVLYFYDIVKHLKDNQPIELGLECYGEKRYFLKESIILELFETYLKNHTNKIIHLTLEGKILNINAFDESDWIMIWKHQKEIVDKIDPNYVICHATSHESRVFTEEEQIENICANFKKVLNIFDRPIFIENTYEDLPFYEKLFQKAPREMNFVFDIGHMKVHSNKDKSDWISFLFKLKEEGRKLHFHIHDNNGKKDEHLNLSEIKNQETIDFVKDLLVKFSDSNFIIETHSDNVESTLRDFKMVW